MSAGEAERLIVWLNGLARDAPVPGEDHRGDAVSAHRRPRRPPPRTHRCRDRGVPDGRGFGIRDGNGIVFVSNTGDVTPSGFLPVSVGNVKHDSLVSLYRDHPTMRALREPDGFAGRCGRCEFNHWCGGSQKARAYAWTGDLLESDPLCPYVPVADRVHV